MRRSLHVLCTTLVSAACAAGGSGERAIVPPQGGIPRGDGHSAESLRAFFASRGLLTGTGEDVGAARAVATMAEVGSRKFAGCPLGDVADTPPAALPDKLNTFAVDFQAADAGVCDQAPNSLVRADCSRLRANCMQVETSIFCDYGVMLMLRNVATLGYGNAIIQAQMDVAYPSQLWMNEVIPSTLLDLSAVQDAWSGTRRKLTEEQSQWPLSLQSIRNRWGSIVQEMMEYATLGMLVGHEAAHVRRSKCSEFPLPAEAVRAEIARYRDVTCQDATSVNELEADLLGVATATLWPATQKRLIQLGFGDSKAPDGLEGFVRSGGVRPPDQAWKALLAQLDTLEVMAHLHALTWLFVVRDDPQRGVEWLSGEPSEEPSEADLRRELTEYYRAKASAALPERGRSDHMLPAYRAALLLQSLGWQDGLAAWPPAVGFRIVGFIRGQLEAAQLQGCPARSPAERTQKIESFLRTPTGVFAGVMAREWIEGLQSD
jgi:hypothetical protein